MSGRESYENRIVELNMHSDLEMPCLKPSGVERQRQLGESAAGFCMTRSFFARDAVFATPQKVSKLNAVVCDCCLLRQTAAGLPH